MDKHLRLLRRLAEQQQYAGLKETAQGLWHDSQDPAVLPLLALAHGQLGEKALAEAVLEQARPYRSEYEVDALADLAAVLILLQRPEEAVVELERILEREPDHALGLARLGYCRMLEEDYPAAQTLLQRAVVQQPRRIGVLLHLIHVHVQQSHFEPAQALLERTFDILNRLGPELPAALQAQHRHQLYDLQLQTWIEQQHYDFAEQWLQEQFSLQQQGGLEEAEFIHQLSHYARLLAERDRHQQAEDILREYLKQFSENSTLYLQLAELCQVQGHFMQAVNLIRKALKREQDNIALWVRLAQVSLHRFDNKARRAAEKALELAEALQEDEAQPPALIRMQQAQARNALAQVESHEQNFEVAERMFRDILAEHENFIPALQGLGQQQMQQGNIDEAVELFERIKQLDPLRGHASLINARRFPEDVEILEKMEKAARVPGLEGPLRASLLFQLAAAWEKRKQYDKAFEFARQANQASKKFLPYDARAHRNQCARIRFGFSRELYQHRAQHGVESALPVYVVGMPRSGTTLVEQIIASHSEIFGAGELGLIPQVAQGLNRWERHVGSGRHYPDCVDDLTPRVGAGIANNVLKEMQEFAPDARHVVDKLPHNFEHIGLIKFLFPQARIISVRRDPRDIAISNYFTDYQAKHGGMGFAYDLTDIGEQLADHNLLMHHWQQLFPGEILELNYEDVVDDLETSARLMLDYIGVEWEPQVLDFNRLERPVKTASVWQVRQPIYKSSKARWKHYQQHLAHLIRGTNDKIRPDEIDMLSLPEPGFLVEGVELYRQGDLDAAELSFKKMLHHNPEHAACRYMVGLVYLSKAQLRDGIAQIEQALEKTPWQREWRDNLLKAYRQAGEHEKAAELESRHAGGNPGTEADAGEDPDWLDEEAVTTGGAVAG